MTSTLKNWTENRALRASNLRFRKVDKLLREVAYLWGDVDEYAVGLCDQLIRLADNAHFEIVASVQLRAEEREAAE
ncbi:hypothetical protein ACVWXN_003504 [Bradyrhizobium sp. i1.4.4]